MIDCIIINSDFWIAFGSIATAVAAFATFGAFIMLFVKDRDKQKQLDKLTRLAGGIDAQNEILKESNNILSAQLDMIRISISATTNSESEVAQQLAEIESKKLKLSVKPKLWLNGAGY